MYTDNNLKKTCKRFFFLFCHLHAISRKKKIAISHINKEHEKTRKYLLTKTVTTYSHYFFALFSFKNVLYKIKQNR